MVTLPKSTPPPGPALPDGLECQIADSFEQVADLREQWDALVEAVDADIYMTFDWCRIWWEFYGDGRKLSLFLFRNAGELVAIFPIFTERRWLGPAWLRVAKLLGSDHAMTLCDPPARPEFAEAAFNAVVEHMLKEHGVDAVSFGPLRGTKRESLPWTSIGKGFAVPLKGGGPHDCHTVFHLPPTVDEYWKFLGTHRRSNFKRRTRMIEKKGALSVTSATEPAACVEMFQKFREMHERQWRAENKLGHFGDWPKSLDFNRVLLRKLSESGRVLIIEIRVDDKPVAYHYCFKFGKREFWRLTARLVDDDWEKIGLGKIALLKKVEQAIRNNTPYVEDGVGHYDHKLEIGGTEYPTRHMLFLADNPSARWRLAAFNRLAKALNFVYYRVWFLKLAPRLPLPRRPLKRVWIRSRI